MPVQHIDVQIGLPWGLGSIGGRWVPDEAERDAAWEMYVELVTRISVVELKRDEGLLREALASLYSLFGTTREILRRGGPDVAKAHGGGQQSFGRIALTILNELLRPVLARWHPLLEEYEATRPEGVSRAEHERSWSRNAELRGVLEDVRGSLQQYADLLAEVCEIDPIHLADRG